MSEMNEQKLDILDKALARLLNGEELDSVAASYPSLQSELEAYERMQTLLASVKKVEPSKEGLSRVLASLRLKGVAQPEPAYFSVTSFMTTYRTAFVLPLLFIVLIASGVFVLPQMKKDEATMSSEFADNTLSSGSVETMSMSNSSVAEDTVAPQMKLFSLAANAPSQSPVPQDAEMSQIFSEELQGDMYAAEVDQSKAVSITDDMGAMAHYDSIYDENDF